MKMKKYQIGNKTYVTLASAAKLLHVTRKETKEFVSNGSLNYIQPEINAKYFVEVKSIIKLHREINNIKGQTEVSDENSTT